MSQVPALHLPDRAIQDGKDFINVEAIFPTIAKEIRLL